MERKKCESKTIYSHDLEKQLCVNPMFLVKKCVKVFGMVSIKQYERCYFLPGSSSTRRGKSRTKKKI